MPKAGSLSARGVPGEAAKDSFVPHYNIFGQQHHRNPFKDKGHFERTVRERPEWTRDPRHRTRTELFTARRAAKHADLSYDFDGDGAVGPTDYFIGKQFSQEQDHRLNTAERARAVRALEEGFLDKYSFGHEQSGAKRAYPVQQARNKILTVDNGHELSEVFPPHWNAHKNPPFKTATDLAHHRKAENTNAADKLKNDWDKKNPAFVMEPPVPRDPTPQVYGKSNRERRELRQREARLKAGIDEVTSYVNPHREEQQTGVDYRHRPPHPTRSVLRETRKAQLIEDLQNTRLAGETDYVPMVARHTWADDFDYEQRRPDPEALTMTKLRQTRKQENIEHNMRNFRLQDVEHPKFSDQEEAWWKKQPGYVHEPPSCLLKELKDPSKEVTGRVVDHVPTRPSARGHTPSESSVVSKGSAATNECADNIEHHGHLKRWTTEFVPQALAEKVPRMFDGVKQAPTYSTDTAAIDLFSSFESISKGAIQKDREQQRRTAMEDEVRAHNWKMHMRGLADPNTGDPGADRSLPHPGSIRSAMSSRAASDTAGPPPPRMTEVMRSVTTSTPLQGPVGEDIPMQERLERLTEKTLGVRISPATVPMTSPMAPISEAGEGSRGGLTPRSNSPTARPGESPKRGATQRPSISSKISESGRGSRLDKVVAADTPSGERRMVVRASGFQWVNKHTPPVLAEDASASSLPVATMMPRTNSKLSIVQDTPPRSRSVSRTHQNSVAAVG